MATDKLRAAMHAGRPLPDGWVIDGHAHLGRWFNFYTPAQHPEGFIQAMDRLGIQVTCVTGLPALVGAVHAGNAMIAEAVQAYPTRLVAYCTINPHQPEAGERELEFWRMPLVKFHPATHNYPMDGPGYAPGLRFAERYRCPVLIHVWQGADFCDPKRLAVIAERYPTVPLIAGHSAGSEDGMRTCIELTRRFPNIYLDPAGSAVYAGSIELLVKGAGADRVVLGTDAGFFDARPQLGRLVFAHITPEERRLVLGENMRRLLLNTALLPEPMRAYLAQQSPTIGGK